MVVCIEIKFGMELYYVKNLFVKSILTDLINHFKMVTIKINF